MLSNVKPMRCKLVKEPFDLRGWIVEIKWDGVRAIAELSKSEVRLYSRNQRSFTRKFSQVVSSLQRLSRKHEAVLDGGLVALDGEGKSGFEWLIRRKSGRGQVVYLVFDLLYLDGQDLRNLPLIRRKGLLKKLVRSVPNVLYVVGSAWSVRVDAHRDEMRSVVRWGLVLLIVAGSRSPLIYKHPTGTTKHS